MPRETLGGQLTNWDVAGEGAPILMLHCAQGSLGTLKGLAGELEGRRILVDSPGHGGSDYDPTRPYLEQSVEVLSAVLDQEGPVDIFGHSYGGLIAMRLASLRPDLVKSLALYEPPSFGLLRDANHPLVADNDPSSFSELTGLREAFDAEDWSNAARVFFTFWEKERSWESLAPQTRDYLVKTVRFIVIQHSSIYGDPSERLMLNDLSAIDIPTLSLHGTKTRDLAKATMNLIADTMPNAELRLLADAGHMGPIGSAPQLAEILRDWLGSGASR